MTDVLPPPSAHQVNFLILALITLHHLFPNSYTDIMSERNLASICPVLSSIPSLRVMV